MSAPRIFMSAGDPSGDMHAARLMRAIRRKASEATFAGIGLDRMQEEGLEHVRSERHQDGTMWLHNLLQIGHFRRLLSTCRQRLQEDPPDLVVLVDFGGFNMYLARAATDQGLPVLYYIPPQAWAHGAHRAKKLRKWTDMLAVVYPFEVDFYAERDVACEYVGHPLFDELAEEPPDEEVVANLQSDDKPRVIGLFPGSRTQEVTRHLPVMLTSCRTLQKQLGGLSFALVCPEAVREPVERILQEKEMEVALPDTRAIELARAADLCLTKSGTITLEIASQHCPMVIFYRVSAFSWFLASGLRPEFLSLVNTLAGDNICPEKLMWRDDREWLATQASKLLMDSDARDICIRNLKQVMKPIAHPGASEKTAELALEMADH